MEEKESLKYACLSGILVKSIIDRDGRAVA
jgi:hypothetical protein